MTELCKVALVLCVASLLIGPAVASAAPAELPPSRAVWWLTQDNVEPTTDLVNTAGVGATPKFVDRLGKFHVQVEGRVLNITGDFPEANIWRFDLATFDGAFDVRKLYVAWGKCAFPDRNSLSTARHAELLGDAERGLTNTGPWEIFNGKWLVPTARVALDDKHIYTSWFDLPSPADQAAGRVYASFALEITKPGRHTVRVSFDDFVYGTRWRPRRPGDIRPPVTRGRNDLRPHHVASIAIGVDERVRDLEKISLKPSLRGKRPRLSGSLPDRGVPAEGLLSLEDVDRMIEHVDFNRGELWEYSIDAESMASENDMDAGRKAMAAAHHYDAHVSRLTPEAKAAWDRALLERFEGLYTFFVFQRNYHPTGYAQNHSSATVGGLIAGGLVWDGPQAERWLRLGTMICRKRIELYGRDGGLEWMNEGRHYGLRYFETPLALIEEGTGVDLTRGEPFFENEWRYALHMSAAFSAPAGQTPRNSPTNFHFNDVDQVFMRSDWGPDAYRARLWAGSVFGKSGSEIAKRYNWAHCRTNAGSFVLGRGEHEILLEPGATRTYRKAGANNNCILINDTDQWGSGQVWHPRLEPDQISRIAMFADGQLLSVARADLVNAYPPQSGAKAVSRCLLQVKPDLFLLFDRVDAKDADGGTAARAEWRFHSAFIEPQRPGSRFNVFGFEATATRPMKDRSTSYDEAFKKDADSSCQVAFLTPGVKADLGMTDAYFRWSPFQRPQRHLKVVRQGGSPLTLLTAFGANLAVESRGNVHRGRHGKVKWVAIEGGSAADGLESDGHFVIAVEEAGTGDVEVYRFGGTSLAFHGTQVASAAEDVFAVIHGGKVSGKVETLPLDH